MSPDEYIETLKAEMAGAGVCVMAHPKNINAGEIAHMQRIGVRMLRLCMDNERPELTCDYIRRAKDAGLIVTLNLTRISQQPLRQLLSAAELARDAGTDVLYLADSNGALTPPRVENLVCMVREVGGINVGFHAHDNLGLAMSNSIAAMDGGATFFDASLRGMGKGAGNLKLELWLAYLDRTRGIRQYDHPLLLEQVEVLEQAIHQSHPIQPLEDLVLGMFDLTVEDKERITANASNIGEVYANAAA
jgi:4-hydroxy 2-oxovalerate aldolase